MYDLKKLLDTIEQGILICDQKGRIEYFNASYGAFIGRELEQVRGMPLLDVRPGAAAPRVLETGKAIQSLYRREYDKA